VQKLFAANERGSGKDFRAVGVLADYAEVPEEHEGAIEQYLRDELEYVVVETFDHARAGVSLLRDEVGGRATFFVDSTRNLKVDEYEPIIPFRMEDGVVSRMDKLVEFRDPLGAAAKQFLPRLRAAYLTDSVSAAEKIGERQSAIRIRDSGRDLLSRANGDGRATGRSWTAWDEARVACAGCGSDAT